MSSSSGKVALTNSTELLSGANPTSPTIRDFVGYGSANSSEGSPAPGTNNRTAVERRLGGCQDTGDNGADFDTRIPPVPRNSGSAPNPCT